MSNSFKFWIGAVLVVGAIYYAYTQRWAANNSRDLDRSVEAARRP